MNSFDKFQSTVPKRDKKHNLSISGITFYQLRDSLASNGTTNPNKCFSGSML